ncbi:E3 ubiquitin-protein ligase SHPRH isoform X2 [Anthonomus grandis grandis]|uniref:E3 ubiquitin-protein ligase SHPRH isoform X2 n=1 Tax=Anthonomus grandis grandis TaxID=2921223 RepID=UPI002165D680|nr:E3 ubiquitin-protein ligase SHPRH isoform X2 [Anthonomus grandis grandis]
MGRTKQNPKKREDLFLGSCSLSTLGEFVPYCYKKKLKKQSTKTPSIPYYRLDIVREDNKLFYLGEILIGHTSNVCPEIIDECKIGFKNDEEQNSVMLDCGEQLVVVTVFSDVHFLKDFVLAKVFSFDIYAQDDNVFFKVYFTNLPPPRCSNKISKVIKAAFELFYGITLSDKSLGNNSNIQHSLTNVELNELYDKIVKTRPKCEYTSLDAEKLDLLRPKLRPYQEQAVQWMIHRETVTNKTNGNIHPLYQKVCLKSGLNVYVDIHTGWVEKEPPLVTSDWKGGILADEMGLGKTVEVLALILSHRDENAHIKDPLEQETNELKITYQTKKNKQPRDDDIVIIEEKRVKVDPELSVEKASARKSATFIALQSMYNRTLSEYCTTGPRRQSENYGVQCICGSINEKDSIQCTLCKKLQHTSCLGYQRRMGPYKCPQCWENVDPISSGATLIVAPSNLRHQWCKEMKSHLKPGLRILNYEGYSATPVYPTELQNYDIVITTYSVLQSELRLTETGQSFKLRRQRKYWPGSSPLVKVKWWRLCLDEAQAVETPGRVVSVMAGKIPAVHRWAVTGTPMAKGVADLFGLIDYLQMEPYKDPETWRYILYDPYLKGKPEAMYDFLSRVLWRTSKDSVLAQINIPAQMKELHLLEFSAVEKFFYGKEHEICGKEFLHIASKYEDELPLEKMNRSDLKNLMAPLFALRQACSDPSAVRGKGRYLSLKKDTTSMKDLLDALILKNKNDCEESLRVMISSINGLAGIYLLSNQPDCAIDEYRKVLQLAAKFSKEEKEGKFHIDKLPLIHCMYNLAEVFKTHPPKEPTLRDDTLAQDCAALETQYITKFMNESASAKESWEQVNTAVFQHEEHFMLKHGQWYSEGFDWIEIHNLEQDFISRAKMNADNANVDCKISGESSRYLLRKIYLWHETLEEFRETLINAIEVIYKQDPETKQIVISQGLVEKAMNCHLRRQQTKTKKKGPNCLICVANGKLKNYEAQLFTMKKRTQIFEEMSLEGSWKPKLEELLLKALLGLLKAKNCKPEWIKDGETHISLIDTLKKEFKEIRKLWTHLDQQVCAQDELDICKVRLQFKTDDGCLKTNRALKNLSYDQKITHENINLILPSEIPHQELTLKSEERTQSCKLDALLGTRNYLETLKQQQFEGYTPDPCPICRGALVNTWVILMCGHTYCMECFQTLLGKVTDHIHCCVCRAKQNLQDVSYIKSSAHVAENNPVEEIQLAQQYSRKVEDVVRLILKLRRRDPLVKILLFSTFKHVLKLLRRALEENDIEAELADASSAFEKRIASFKDPLKKITVLLLPIRLGSKGLNLIEATHVVLLEPLLNPADELQAIGRVHRIGQTKPTFVHKFLIKNTIEESVYNATSANSDGWERGRITVGQLKDARKM